jgi:uncharacterized ferredoxin-like protein
MTIIDSETSERDAILTVAKLMVTSARTAPKAGGRDNIKTMIVLDEDKNRLAEVMNEMGRSRDSGNVRDSGAVVLIGVDYDSPAEDWMNFKAKLLDLGIAVGSAVKTASDMNVDNRIMVTIGRAAIKMGLMKADEVQGIPLSIKGKNIFFDRKTSIPR